MSGKSYLFKRNIFEVRLSDLWTINKAQFNIYIPLESGRFIAFIAYTISCDRQKEISRLPRLFYLGTARREKTGWALVYHWSPGHQTMIQIHREICKSLWFITVLYLYINHLIIIPNGI